MTTSLENLPQNKQAQLKKIVKIIHTVINVEMIVLFGSYARGDFVDKDVHQEGHITYEYRSDFDILVLLKDVALSNDLTIWNKINKKISQTQMIDTPVSIIVETIADMNEHLSFGRYFFVDIKKQGIVLYSSNKYGLIKPRNLEPEEKAKMAQEDLDFWLKKAHGFSRAYDLHCSDEYYSLASFNLHQRAEALFTAFALVFTTYRPKTHDLQKFIEYCHPHNEKIQAVFPRKKDGDKEAFQLLQNAYIDARYKKHYMITKEQLEFLEKCVGTLEEVIKKDCKEKIQK